MHSMFSEACVVNRTDNYHQSRAPASSTELGLSLEELNHFTIAIRVATLSCLFWSLYVSLTPRDIPGIDIQVEQDEG